MRRRLRGWGADALLVTNRKDIRYLTGFIGDDSWAVVPAGRGAVTVISDLRFQQQIQREAPHVAVRMRRAGLSVELAQWVKRAGCQRIAIQRDWVTLAQHKALVKQVGAKRLKPVDDGLLQQRAVKTPDELWAIRRALKIQQEAFKRMVQWIKPGISEQAVAAYLEYQMRLLGADGCSFPSIVAVGSNAALPHAIPGARKVKRGLIVLVDWGARYKGYCGDLTRVICIGQMPKRMQRVYQVVLEAQRAAIDAIKPGVALKAIDAVARGVIEQAGYGDRFGHSLGHGLGLNVHEQPVLSAKAKGVLEPGQVVTVEPGVYLPGVGGVRIEDDVLVTDRGRRVLSDLPTDLGSTMI